MSAGLLSRIAAGDHEAVEECLTQYGGLVWSLALRYIPNRDEAEEAVQEVFVDLWRHAGRFDFHVASEATFVAVIARRRLIDYRRKLQRTIPTTSIPAELNRAVPDQLDVHAMKDEITWAREQLTRLRPIERQVLEMVIDNGLSHSEIAEALEIPLGTVKTNARRGLIRLREFCLQSPPRHEGEEASS